MPSFRRLLERRRRLRAQAAFAELHGSCVLTGPFRGMRYPADLMRTRNVNMASRRLGSYEAELHEIVERVVAAGFEHVIDVGTGEGYYAVGLARRTVRVDARGRACRDPSEIVEDYPEIASLDEHAAAAIVCEWRPANLRWALLTPSA